MDDCPENPQSNGTGFPIDRRTFLGSVVLSASGSLTGCMEIANWIGDQALGDVNIFNETDRRMRGDIVITGPRDSKVLSESFDLEAQTEDEPNSEAMIAYEEVWKTTGEYRITVELEDGYSIRGQRKVDSVVEIEDTEEQMLGIGIGIPDREAGIVTLVVTEWSGFAES